MRLLRATFPRTDDTSIHAQLEDSLPIETVGDLIRHAGSRRALKNLDQRRLPLARRTILNHAAACHGSLTESLPQKANQLIDGVES